jgi:hypothetical protein
MMDVTWKLHLEESPKDLILKIYREDCMDYEEALLFKFDEFDGDLPYEMAKEVAEELVQMWNTSRKETN